MPLGRTFIPVVLTLLCAATPVTVTVTAQQTTAADALIADAHYLRARPLTQATLQKSPDDVHAIIQSSILSWAFFHFDEAITKAEKAVALADRSADAHTQLTNALGAKLVSSSAGTFEKMSLARRFRKEADLSLELDPKSFDAIEDSARFYWNAPSVVGGDRSKAQQLADRLTHLDPTRGAALKAGFAADEKDKAKRDAATESIWRTAVAAQPDSADAHAGLGAALFEEGKLPQAEAADRRAIALKPTRIAPYRQLAVIYATAGRWDDLEKLLKQAHTAVPDNLSPDYHAARIILTNNAAAQLGHAEQYLRAYLAQPAEGEEPSHAAAHWRLGLILEKQGRKNDAVQELRDAVHEDGSLEDAKKDLKRLS
ncbi:tetratricopeptide repeat protein [Granulicella arctica]|uniref:tetratricopeptide repeat protein n=1 Tax=Granulicella arctica TaxID=940613 RepID=UPI0021DF80C4|nr:tetratricopeptide repeat protein [Granulicella arctica]